MLGHTRSLREVGREETRRRRTDGVSWTHGRETIQELERVKEFGAREHTIESREDPVLQGADEDSWARAVDLEAIFYGGDRTALSGMAAEKFWSSLFIAS